MKSLNRGNDVLRCSSDQCRSVGRLSVLMPNTSAFASPNLDIPAWYAVISFVQPPVNAAGKNASTTLDFPRKSDRVTLPPVVAVNVKSGAGSPTFKLVCGGCVAWPKRAADAPHRSSNTFFI